MATSSLGDRRKYRRPSNWKYCRSLKHIPGLSEDERMILRETTQELMVRYLDCAKPWHAQEPQCRDKLISQCRQEMPFLNKYENAWPVEGLSRYWLEKSAYVFQGKRPDWQTHAREREQRPAGCPQKLQEPTSADEKKILSHPSAPRTSSMTLHGAARTEQPSDAIRTFLGSLYPPLDALTPLFLEGGIHDQDCLTGLAAMSKKDLKEFLVDDLDLDSFQALKIRKALKRLRSPAGSDRRY
ncbi:hypothetical protein NM688_g1177 [Phlebia brevispora]|uniref:Uncharacterized protein n=1 Tax=Phlebia brevispora TaxID=194682 RepID=A0ACC1TC82_9APHY|nr:hypothetical protein NM688_g1177 [Phlebia brevispora]